MPIDDAKRFWSSQTTSLHRFSETAFYTRKAEEHAATMSMEDRIGGCIDLGCGAGELLQHLATLVRVDAGLDYSASMLGEAAQRLRGLPIELVEADPLDYLPAASHRVWITTGAINQYYPADRLRRLLDLLGGHPHARALYLFDCVDPLRYRTRSFGSRYRPTPNSSIATITQRLRRTGARWRVALALAAGRFEAPIAPLGPSHLGFGQRPDFWIREAQARSIEIEIVSSRFYEYRYHVCLRRSGSR